MAAHLIIVACLVASPGNCQEFPLPEVTSEDVPSCIGESRVKAVEWEEKNDGYRVIATKCVKTE
jgi:hypothetical protein